MENNSLCFDGYKTPLNLASTWPMRGHLWTRLPAHVMCSHENKANTVAKLNFSGQRFLDLDMVTPRRKTEARVPLYVPDPTQVASRTEYLPFSPRPPVPPKDTRKGTTYERDGVTLHCDDSLNLYERWPTPVCIVSDGAYGVSGFPGDPPTHNGLASWYRPHIEEWTKKATPLTTLWFWNTEVGWATVHPVLVELGWEYVACHVWNKGMGHIAGNSNTKTLRQFPIVTEVCAQYVKPATFDIGGSNVSMQAWLRHEWLRSKLPMYLANKACGVKNAATRKYLTSDHVWYFPPPEAFASMAHYLNTKGDPNGRPYFSLDGQHSLSASEWERMRSKFHCKFGINNVWNEPAVRGQERLKGIGAKCLHTNQKPLKLLELIIEASTDPGDMVWDPFGGLCSTSIAAHKLNRRSVSAEIERIFFLAASNRLANYDVF